MALVAFLSAVLQQGQGTQSPWGIRLVSLLSPGTSCKEGDRPGSGHPATFHHPPLYSASHRPFPVALSPLGPSGVPSSQNQPKEAVPGPHCPISGPPPAAAQGWGAPLPGTRGAWELWGTEAVSWATDWPEIPLGLSEKWSWGDGS